jgi:UDP-N-acetyl-D-mannosaminuronic acid dehydrogenase
MLFLSGTSEIQARVASRDVKIAFIGLGRVGLPLAATLADQGFSVTGIDINTGLVAMVNRGETPFPEEDGMVELVKKVTAAGRLKATTDMSETFECDVVIIAVPTLIKNEQPDIDAVIEVSHSLKQCFPPGKLVVLQSTVPPGTTESVLAANITEYTGLVPGRDFGYAYSPERTQSPQVLRDLVTYPKIIGAMDYKSALMVSEIYSTFAPSIIRMQSVVAAELDKVVENAYRDVNIAFANELALLCQLYGVDVQELIKTANSQPYSHILQPGLVGGHCIPMDPYYVISDAARRGLTPQLMQTARRLNESMFQQVADMIVIGMQKITILGLSFKPDVKSFETSHTLKLVRLLTERGYDVTVHDPFLNAAPFSFKTEADIYKALKGTDCLILSTAHSHYKTLAFDLVKTAMRGNLVIDVRGFFDPATVKAAGLKYQGIGRTLYA